MWNEYVQLIVRATQVTLTISAFAPEMLRAHFIRLRATLSVAISKSLPPMGFEPNEGQHAPAHANIARNNTLCSSKNK